MSEEFKEGYRQVYRDGYQDGKGDLSIDTTQYCRENIDMPTVADEWIKQNIRRCSVCQGTVMSFTGNCGRSDCPQPIYQMYNRHTT